MGYVVIFIAFFQCYLVQPGEPISGSPGYLSLWAFQHRFPLFHPVNHFDIGRPARSVADSTGFIGAVNPCL